MKIKTPWRNGEIGVIHASLGDVPVLRLLQYKCPELRIEVTLNGGKRCTLIALKEIDLSHALLTELNNGELPHVSHITALPLTPAHLDNLLGLGQRESMR